MQKQMCIQYVTEKNTHCAGDDDDANTKEEYITAFPVLEIMPFQDC